MFKDYRCWQALDYLPATGDVVPVPLVGHVRAGQLALDVGCHHGAASLFMASLGLGVLGIDINPRAIELARQREPAGGSGRRPEWMVGDFLGEEFSPPGSFDVVILNRFLTCLPRLEDWQSALARTRQLLTAGGLIYVNDFLLMPACAHNRSRYQQSQATDGRWGNFAVLDEHGRTRFIAHHHSGRELRQLVAPYRLLSFRRYSTSSRHGHPSRMFELVGVKDDCPA